jgi:preprotein translocase SecF subunit
MIEIFKSPKYNFIGFRKYAFTFSGILLLITLGSIVFHKGFNASIEFTGGTMVHLKFAQSVNHDLGKIRTIIGNIGFGQPEIKTLGASSANEIQIIVKKQMEGTYVSDEIKAALIKSYPDNAFEVRKQEKVGPKISAELSRNSAYAIILSLIAIILYMWIRFNLPYGFGAIVALFHDVFIVLGYFSLFNKEISLGTIAALLTIVGYSLNDTIVIFDRVRENLSGRLTSSTNLADVINSSINQCLARTILTSSTVLFVLIAFAVFSGDVIGDFAEALLVGCTSGIYSTVYIASPVVIWWYKKWPAKK